jgi:Tol biopolymer transport system component
VRPPIDRVRRSGPSGIFASAPYCAAVVALLTIAACGGSGSATSSSPAAAASQTAASPSVAASPSATPLPTPTVAGTIAFAKVVTAGSGGNSDIYVVNADGTGLKQLTNGLGWENHPSWSPDGTRMVYTVYPPSDDDATHADLWVMNADGSGQRQLSSGSAKGDWAVWSPDGRTIAFQRARTWSDLAIFSLDSKGGGLKRVTRPAPGASAGQQADTVPDWAPDGRVLFLRLSDVYSVNAAGGDLTRLTKIGNVGEFAVSPDGKSLAVDNLTSRSIEIVPARGGRPRATLLKPVADYVPDDPYVAVDWTQDGSALAMAGSSLKGVSGSRLYVVNSDGTGLSAVPGIDAAMDPAWRPQ